MFAADEEILRRDFKHGKTAYAFQWNQGHHKTLGNVEGDLAALWAHLTSISHGRVPDHPFKDSFYTRASALRFKRLSPARKVGLRRRFFRNGLLEERINDEIVFRIREYHRKMGDLSYTADHSILQQFLFTDSKTIAIEVPVWSERYKLSGHIDLIRCVNGVIQVCDYKPGPMEQTKNRFLTALPQVAAYGEMLSHHLAQTLRTAINAPLLPEIQCCIFDTHSSWHFKADMFVKLSAANLIEFRT